MLVKSLVLNFLKERERLFLVFPFFAVCLQVVLKKMRIKAKIIVCRFAYVK